MLQMDHFEWEFAQLGIDMYFTVLNLVGATFTELDNFVFGLCSS